MKIIELFYKFYIVSAIRRAKYFAAQITAEGILME